MSYVVSVAQSTDQESSFHDPSIVASNVKKQHGAISEFSQVDTEVNSMESPVDRKDKQKTFILSDKTGINSTAMTTSPKLDTEVNPMESSVDRKDKQKTFILFINLLS